MAGTAPKLGNTTAVVDTQETSPPPPDTAEGTVATPESVVIHFVTDGFVAFGRTWYRGQELEISTSSEEWPETLVKKHKKTPDDKKHWPLLTEHEQIAKYGKRVFASGPWPGRRDFEGASFEPLKDASAPSRDELAIAVKAGGRVKI